VNEDDPTRDYRWDLLWLVAAVVLLVLAAVVIGKVL
jgi:hypothetical protein